MLGHELSRELGISENLLKGFALIAGVKDFKPSDELSDVVANKLIATWAAGQPRPVALYALARELKVPAVHVIRMCRRLGIVASVPNDQITEFDSRRITTLLHSVKGVQPSPPGWIDELIYGYSLLSDQSELEEDQVVPLESDGDPADFFDLELLGHFGVSPKENRMATRRWPSASQYDDALLNAKSDFLIERLREMRVLSGEGGDSSIFSTGAFACVARVEIEGRQWAMRMFVRSQDEIVERYRGIRLSQERGELTGLLVPVDYVENAVQVRIDEVTFTYPVVLVQWIDGLTFSRFVVRAYEDGNDELLDLLVRAMRGLRSEMADLEVAHGDLSPDNMIVSENDAGLKVHLLDYDSVWFPEIAHLRCSVSEEGDFQHPSRPNPIGPMADQVAFEMYDLTLRFLASGEKVEGLRNLFDQRILLSREEWTDGVSEIAKRLQKFDQGAYDRIAQCLLSDYGSIEELLLRGTGSDIGVPATSVNEGLTFDQVSAALEISSGRLGQVLRQIGRDQDDLFTDADLEKIKRMVSPAITIRQDGASEATLGTEEKTNQGEISLAEVARRIGLDVVSASALVQDVVGRSVGATSVISRAELDKVRARVREDREFKFELTKVCQAAGMGPKRGLELLSDELPGAIRIRPYSVRVTAGGRDFLMRYLQRATIGQGRGSVRGTPSGMVRPNSSQTSAPLARKRRGLWRR